MVMFNYRKAEQSAGFDYQLTRLIALADDMKSMQTGGPHGNDE